MFLANKILKLVLAVAIVSLLFSCEEAKVERNLVARVGTAKLYQQDVDNYLVKMKTKIPEQEFIRRWIERELLFQEALLNEVDKSEQFASIVVDSRKELAAAFQRNNFLSSQTTEPEEVELEEYYHANFDEFKLRESAYNFNFVEFNDELEAKKFRVGVLSQTWQDALIKANKAKILNVQNNYVSIASNLQPFYIPRILQKLEPEEISIILKSEPNKFVLVQLLNKFAAGDLLPFEYMKEEIKERVIMIRQNQLISEFIKSLYSKYDVEIIKDR